MAELVDKALLKTLIPPSALNSENFQELAAKTYVEVVPAGKLLFKQGDMDKQKVYVLEGEVTLTAATGEVTVVKGGTPVGKHPIANQQPRKHNAIAKTPAKIVRVDTDLLDILLTWDQLSGIEVGEISADTEQGDEGGDWMTRILQSRAFLQVPAANIQAMFMRIQEVPVQAGDVIIKQGDDGDYYYIIKHGRCKVTRTSKSNTQLTLATLKDGDAFGEEALLSDAKRNANIIMETDGSLMRLSKEDFNSLLKEPMLSWVTNSEAENMVASGETLWLDVRLDSEHKNNGITGSINVPLFMLRMKAESLDPSKKYILYCDTGRRSSAGAFLLSERGITAYCLKGGLQARGSSV
jgi:CRP-like cAMP-binding protein